MVTDVLVSKPTVIKVKKGIPTVIEWNGQRYVLDNEGGKVVKSKDSKPSKNSHSNVM